MRGGACPSFLSPFHKCIFGQYKESISSEMPTFELGCIVIVYYNVYIVF